MSTRRARPVITVVEARPMSEVGFPGVKVEQPRQPVNSTTPPAIITQSPAVAVHPESIIVGSSKPLPLRNFNAEPKPLAAPRPEPKPRPKSVMVSKSVSLFEMKLSSDDSLTQTKLPADRPMTNTRPTIIRPKPNTVSQRSDPTIVESEKIDVQRPPPKPKPVALQRHGSLSEFAEAREGVMPDVNNEKIDNKWKKPTIIRPSGSNAILNASRPLQQQQAALPLPIPRQQQPLNNDQWSKSTEPVETSWIKKEPVVVDRSGDCMPDMTSLQAKPKPTIIRRNMTPASGNVSEKSENLSMIKTQEDLHVVSQHVENNSKNHFDGRSATQTEIFLTRSAASYHVEISHETQEERQPIKSLPPAKPPPPKVTKGSLSGSNSMSSLKVLEDREKRVPAARPKVPSLHSSRSSDPPQRPPAKLGQQKGSAPQLPPRPAPGHPLYHYVYNGPRALALFDYDAAQSDELSFSAGNVIILEKWINAEWIFGSTGTRSGMFPVNFVEIIEPLPVDPSTPIMKLSRTEPSSTTAASWSDPVIGPRCVARFDYVTDEADDLSFIAGDVISLVERVGDEWMRGELNGKTGLFPLAFVEVLEDLPAEPASTYTGSALNLGDQSSARHVVEENDSSRPYCIAEFDFESQAAEDLSFITGDRILLLERVNAEWLKGSVNGREGIFPSSFVKIICDFDEPPPRLKSPARANSWLSDAVPHQTSGQRSNAFALYDFDGDPTAGDLCFRAGDTISDVVTVSDEWMSGRIGQKTGIFPSGFVRVT